MSSEDDGFGDNAVASSSEEEEDNDEFLLGSGGSDEEDDDLEEGPARAKDGFADAMAKVLGESVGAAKRPIMAKRTTEAMRSIAADRAAAKLERQRRQAKKARADPGYVKPSASNPAELTKERMLRKLGTTGVVTLFNTIRKVQRQETDADAAGEGRKGAGGGKDKDKVKGLSKDDFLGMLKTTAGSAKPSKAAIKAKAGAAAGPTGFAALQEGFMMGGKMSDWHHGGGGGSDDEAQDDEAALGWDDDALPSEAQQKTARDMERGEEKKANRAADHQKASNRVKKGPKLKRKR
jgi:hypothetical protein